MSTDNNSSANIALASAGYQALGGWYDDAEQSAEVIVPKLMHCFAPKNVVDVGCGLGRWLSAFRAAGVSDILGVDASWVPREKLQIPEESFQVRDLTAELKLGRRFDLAICLEVAEHLPESAADTLLDSLIASSDAIAFSAAIPGQGGYGHVNEQYQSYWVSKFASRNYFCYDLVRPQVWQDQRVAFWYAQNLLIYVKQGVPLPTALSSLTPLSSVGLASLVHPELYRRRLHPVDDLFRKLKKVKRVAGQVISKK